MVFGFLNGSTLKGTLEPGFLLSASPLQLPPCLGRLRNYIIWRWNESTLQAKVSEMLYWSRNWQLKSNTWNTEARRKQPCPQTTGPNQPFAALHGDPPTMFFFPSSLFFFLFKSLFVKSCRQSAFTLAYIAHKSPNPDMLVKRINKAHFLSRA